MRKSCSSDKITILIPTFNRYPLLRRLLDFYVSSNFSVKILILDSSSNQIDISEQFLSNKNTQYIKYGSDIYPIKKISEGLKNVFTPYVVICADDDLISPRFFEYGIEFLEKNKDFSIAHGESYLFDTTSNYDRNVINCISPYYQRSILDETSTERLMNNLNDYATTFYSIHRTENLKRNIDLCYSCKLDYNLSELLLSCLSVINGKVKKINHLYMLRESLGLRYKNYNVIDVFDRVVSETFSHSYKKFSCCLTDELVRYEDIDFDKAKDVVKKAFWSYLSNGLCRKFQSCYAKRENSYIRIYKKNVLKKIPGVNKYLLPIWRAIRFNLFCSVDMSSKKLFNPFSSYRNDFRPLYHAITALNKDYKNEEKTLIKEERKMNDKV